MQDLHDQDAAGAADERPPRHRRAGLGYALTVDEETFTTSRRCTPRSAPPVAQRRDNVAHIDPPAPLFWPSLALP